MRDSGLVLTYRVSSTTLTDRHGELEYEYVSYDLDLNFISGDTFGDLYNFRLTNWRHTAPEDATLVNSVGVVEILGDRCTLLESYPQADGLEGFAVGDSVEHPHPFLLDNAVSLFRFVNFADSSMSVGATDSIHFNNSDDEDDGDDDEDTEVVTGKYETIQCSVAKSVEVDWINGTRFLLPAKVFTRNSNSTSAHDNDLDYFVSRSIDRERKNEILTWTFRGNLMLAYELERRSDRTFTLDGQLTRLRGTEEQQELKIEFVQARRYRPADD